MIRVESGPGTGKTFGLVRRAQRIVHPEGLGVAGRDVLIVAFNRVIAKQLQVDIDACLHDVPEQNRPIIRTVHALCLTLIGSELRLLLPHEREAMLYDVLCLYPALRAQYETHRKVEQALRDREAKHKDHTTLWQAVRRWLIRHRAQLISDLPGLVLDKLDGGDLEDQVYRHIIVDEFQDLTAGEQKLFLRLRHPNGHFLALETLTKWTDEDIPTDQGAAPRHQCFVNVSTPVRPQSELPRPMEPRDRPLHNPTIATQPTPMGRAALREVGTDAAATQAAAVWLGVVGPIGVQRLRTTARPARLASDRRNRVHQGLQFADIGGVGPGQSRRQRDASPIGDDVVFAPWFGPIGGVWAGLLAAAQRAHRTAVNRCMRPVDPIGGLKFSQKVLMQGLPDAGLMPITQAPPAGHAATAAQFTGQVFPADAGPEHKKDAGECLAVIDWLSSGEAEPARLRWRQQRFDTVPEFVR